MSCHGHVAAQPRVREQQRVEGRLDSAAIQQPFILIEFKDKIYVAEEREIDAVKE
jgi:hypothetical protein